MTSLWLTLIPIALIDSVTPVRFSILSTLLASSRPVVMGYAFIFGLFTGYLAIGSLILFGLDKVFDELAPKLEAEWNRPPDSLDYFLQLVIGILIVVFSYRAAKPKPKVEAKAKNTAGALVPVFLLGAIPAFTPTPGMLPYFAAIDQILKSDDLSRAQMFATLIFYCLVFLVPPSALVLLRVVSKKWSDRVFGAIGNFFATWGKGALIALLVLLGLVLIVDAVGGLIGHPLIPVS